MLNQIRSLRENIRYTSAKILSEKSKKEEYERALQEHQARILSKSRYLDSIVDSFDEEKFVNKIAVDNLYYEVLSNSDKLEKEHPDLHSLVESVITEMYVSLMNLCKHVNVTPKPYGFYKNEDGKIVPVNESILNESIAGQRKIIETVISEYLAENYTNYTVPKRERLYYDKAKSICEEFIREGLDAETAMEVAIYTVVMENFVRKISLTDRVQKLVNNLLEDEDYAEIFDVETLNKLYDDYNEKCYKVAKTLALVKKRVSL